eukprot:TRINITY_DN7449_c0_g2_i1.p2 TRINITY_DN7449_c0_g2~~TRINITY_DN7449_c0_g2_i1.p2  ORF type:complete len:209 (+),score=73.66 TRINITY_DN7449_c0_g2_i1:110-736(+)
MAYLLTKFKQFDVHKNGYIGDELMKVVGMATHPTNGSDALSMYHKLKFGADHGADTLWKLDNNGDGRVCATEWALFFVRIAGGNPAELVKLAGELRLHDVNTLMAIRSRGLLRDRHIALFDAADADGSGSLDVREMVALVHASNNLVLFEEEQESQIAMAQLKMMDKDGDDQIQLAEWLRFVQMRGELDEMTGRNFHYFEEVYGSFNV